MAHAGYARRFGMNVGRAERCLDRFPAAEDRVQDLVSRSFLSAPAQVDYGARFRSRMQAFVS